MKGRFTSKEICDIVCNRCIYMIVYVFNSNLHNQKQFVAYNIV